MRSVHASQVGGAEEVRDSLYYGKLLLLVVNDGNFFLTHRLNIAQAAKDRGMDVIIAAPDEPCCERITELGFQVCPLFLKRWSFNPFDDIRAVSNLVRIYRRLNPDIVHHVTIKPVVYGSLAAQIAGVPAVVNAVSGLGYMFCGQGVVAKARLWFVKQLYRIALKHPQQKVIFQNPDDKKIFLQERFVTPDEIVLIRGSGVDPSEFFPTPEPPLPVAITMSGRLLWNKGVKEFVEAATLLRDRGVQAHFRIAGEAVAGNPDSIDIKQIRAWQNSSPVEFIGFQPNMCDIYHQSHIVCLPSYREGLPKALIEAAASGKPIVASDEPGCREIVQHEVNGLLVPPRDSVRLADALQKLIENSELRMAFGSASRNHFMEGRFSSDAIVAETLAVYESLLKQRN